MSLLLFSGLYGFRLLGGLCLQTYFDPDEYWQCIEPAAKLAFGQGALTWEWRYGVRSWNYPVVFAIAMIVIKRLTGLSDAVIVEIVPKALQALITTTIDYYTYLLVKKTSPKVAKKALLLSMCSWFMFAYVNRTLSNSLEAALTAAAIYHEGSTRAALIAISTIVRPTAVLNWLFVADKQMLNSLLMPTVVTHFWNALFDSLFYGELTFVPVNFMFFNLGRSGVSTHFGVSSALFYFTNAIPAVLLSYIVYFVRGLSLAPRKYLAHIWGPLLIYSLLAHKEIRFIMPLVPIIHFICALGMRGTGRRWFKSVMALQFIAILIFAFSHQSAPVSIVKVLRAHPEWHEKVLFLTPCHSVPWIGYLAVGNERAVDWRQLECDPTRLDAEGLDESDHFYLVPEAYVAKHTLPDTVVTFEPLQELMVKMNFKAVHRQYNGLWNPDPRRAGDLIIWRRQPV